jgi:hypothetical protein
MYRVIGLVVLLGFPPMVASNELSLVEGHFRPNAAPESPERKAVGDHCIVDVKQKYALSGDLDGVM